MTFLHHLDPNTLKRATKAFDSLKDKQIVLEKLYKDPFSIIEGDSLKILPTMKAESVDTCVTSPPYFGLRDYVSDEQIGAEELPEQYIPVKEK